MKKTILIIFSALASIICFSQNKQITLEDIWLNYSLFPKSYSNLNSLNSGEHYSMLERVDKGQEIIKYNFKTGKKNRTVFKSIDFNIEQCRTKTEAILNMQIEMLAMQATSQAMGRRAHRASTGSSSRRRRQRPIHPTQFLAVATRTVVSTSTSMPFMRGVWRATRGLSTAKKQRK